MDTLDVKIGDRLPTGYSPQKALYRTYQKASAAKKGLSFTLPFGLFVSLTSLPCHYCGVSPQQVIKGRRGGDDYRYNGLDRVDSSKGYIAENVVPCCRRCKSAKSDASVADFVSWARRVVSHNAGYVPPSKRVLPGSTPCCTCGPQDRCPLGRSSTQPRCTLDDLQAECDRRGRANRLDLERRLACLLPKR